MVNSNKIKGRMREMNITQADVSRFLGIATSTVSQKLNNTRGISLEEAEKLTVLLNIQLDDFGTYFFA